MLERGFNIEALESRYLILSLVRFWLKGEGEREIRTTRLCSPWSEGKVDIGLPNASLYDIKWLAFMYVFLLLLGCLIYVWWYVNFTPLLLFHGLFSYNNGFPLVL